MYPVLALATLLALVPAFAQDPPWVGDARMVAGAVPAKVRKMLATELGHGSVGGAIDVWRDKAPKMAKAIADETGWSIRHVSLRNRSPRAVPDEWERAALEEFDRRAAAGESPATLEKYEVTSEGGRQVYRYMRALPAQSLCVECHGSAEDVAPEVRARLDKLYPDDKAVGYREAQIRGAITIRKSM